MGGMGGNSGSLRECLVLQIRLYLKIQRVISHTTKKFCDFGYDNLRSESCLQKFIAY